MLRKFLEKLRTILGEIDPQLHRFWLSVKSTEDYMQKISLKNYSKIFLKQLIPNTKERWNKYFIFVPFKMFSFRAEITREKYGTFPNSFHSEVKLLIRRLERVKDRIDKHEVSFLFNHTYIIHTKIYICTHTHTHTHIYIYIYLKPDYITY